MKTRECSCSRAEAARFFEVFHETCVCGHAVHQQTVLVVSLCHTRSYGLWKQTLLQRESALLLSPTAITMSPTPSTLPPHTTHDGREVAALKGSVRCVNSSTTPLTPLGTPPAPPHATLPRPTMPEATYVPPPFLPPRRAAAAAPRPTPTHPRPHSRPATPCARSATHGATPAASASCPGSQVCPCEPAPCPGSHPHWPH